MERMILHTQSCKGCGYCRDACPRKAIRFLGAVNAHGYEVCSVDESLCVRCGICYTVCPDYVFELIPAEEGGTAQ